MNTGTFSTRMVTLALTALAVLAVFYFFPKMGLSAQAQEISQLGSSLTGQTQQIAGKHTDDYAKRNLTADRRFG